MLAHVMSNEDSIQHLVYLKQTGQLEECLQQSILILPQIYEENQQAAVLCKLIESAFELAGFQEAAYYFPLFERVASRIKNPTFSIHHLLFKGHFHIRIHGDAAAALTFYQEGLAVAFEEKEYSILPEFIKYIIRYSWDEVEVNKLLPMAELAYILSQRMETPQESVRISAAMALLECYSLAGNVEQFEKLEKQLSILPSLPNFPNELTRLQVLRAKILRDQGYYAQALCLMTRSSLYYERQQEHYLLLQLLYTQKQLSMEFMPDRVAALDRKIERTHWLTKQASSHFNHSIKKEESYREETAIFPFHQSIDERLRNEEKFLYLLALAEEKTYFQALAQFPAPSLVLSENRILYVMKENEVSADFLTCNLPGIFFAAIQPQKGQTALELFHEAHAKMYYMLHSKK
ncbi:hypothetical protein [Lysinibacillus sp. 3P01SB]|uniref:hypothetical protein n=1 Tax=Lysinibacillus sp. 3P01SB TaxID=3132284 RepID=UPI0039A52890